MCNINNNKCNIDYRLVITNTQTHAHAYKCVTKQHCYSEIVISTYTVIIFIFKIVKLHNIIL